MKVNEILWEGLFGDLRAIGQQAQKDQLASLKGSVKQGVDAFKSAITPDAVKKLAARTDAYRKTQATKTLAQNIAQAWEKELAQLTAGATTPMSNSDYQQRFSAWLENAMQGEVRVDERNPEFQKYVSGATPQVLGYLENYFIPAYQALKAQVPPQIPNGTRVVVRGAQAGTTQVPDEIYVWNNGRWQDSKGGAVIAGSSLHQGLSAEATKNLKATSATAQTI